MSTIRLSRAALPYLEQRGGGSITNIVSISVKQLIPNLILSNTARTAVVGFTKSIAAEFAHKQIWVNNVCPGSILTGRIRSLAAPKVEAAGRDIEDLIEEEGAAIPLGRHGTPQEFANAGITGGVVHHRGDDAGGWWGVQGIVVGWQDFGWLETEAGQSIIYSPEEDIVMFSCIDPFIYSGASFNRNSLIWRGFAVNNKCSRYAISFI